MKKVKNNRNQTQFINEREILAATPFKSSKSNDWYVRLNMRGATEALLIGAYNSESDAEQVIIDLIS